MEHSFPRLFVLMVELRSQERVPGNFCSREWMNPGPFVPRTIHSLEHSFLIIKSCETSFFSGSWSSNAQVVISYGDSYFYFCQVFFHFRSGFYFRNCGGTSVTPYLWPKDHGGGHFCTTDGPRMRHYSRQRVLSGHQTKSDSLPRLIQPMLHVGMVSTELLRTTQPKCHYRIDLEQHCSTYGKDHDLSASVKQS